MDKKLSLILLVFLVSVASATAIGTDIYVYEDFYGDGFCYKNNTIFPCEIINPNTLGAYIVESSNPILINGSFKVRDNIDAGGDINTTGDMCIGTFCMSNTIFNNTNGNYHLIADKVTTNLVMGDGVTNVVINVDGQDLEIEGGGITTTGNITSPLFKIVGTSDWIIKAPTLASNLALISPNSAGRMSIYPASSGTVTRFQIYYDGTADLETVRSRMTMTSSDGVFTIGTNARNGANLQTIGINIGGNQNVDFELDGKTTFNFNVDMDGDLTVDGKLTVLGGTDPPYVLYNMETRESIVERIRQEIPESKAGGMALFYLPDMNRYESFNALDCTFYVEAIDDKTFEPYFKSVYVWDDGEVCYNTDSIMKYYWDKITGVIKQKFSANYGIKIPEDKIINQTTGELEDKPNEEIGVEQM